MLRRLPLGLPAPPNRSPPPPPPPPPKRSPPPPPPPPKERSPPPPPPKGRSPPPPNEGGRLGRSSAEFTRRARPPNSYPLNFSTARAASSSDSNVTKAKPRGRPLSRSVGRNTSETLPSWANSVSSSSRLDLKLRLPTKILAVMGSSLLAVSDRVCKAAPDSVQHIPSTTRGKRH